MCPQVLLIGHRSWHISTSTHVRRGIPHVDSSCNPRIDQTCSDSGENQMCIDIYIYIYVLYYIIVIMIIIIYIYINYNIICMKFLSLIQRLLFGRRGIYCKCLNACPISFHRQVMIDGAPSFKTKLARSSYTTSQVGQRKVAVAGSHRVHGPIWHQSSNPVGPKIISGTPA